MRDRTYWLFALVAWPAAVWGCIEIVLRLASGETSGMMDTLMITSAAATTIGLARWRRQGMQIPVRS